MKPKMKLLIQFWSLKNSSFLYFAFAAIVISGCSSTKPQYQAVLASSTSAVNESEVWEPSVGNDLPILRENRAQQIFRDYGVNPTVSTKTESISTFAMDVDTASYKIAKESIENHQMPPKAAIRVEEFVNNFDYAYQTGEDIFSIGAEVVPSPFRPGFHVLHVGIQAQDIPSSERLPAHLVLVADVSGSMAFENKMALQKEAFTTLVSQLKPDDTVALVAYQDNAKVILKPTSAKHRSKIYRAIKKLQAGGGTNAVEGLIEGYQLAEEIAYPGYINRVILTSDGMANIGSVEPKEMVQKIQQYREKNIFLTTVGVGRSMYNDYLLEQLANHGNGNYLYFANTKDIQAAFVDGLTTQLQAVAKDAKVQIQFDPNVVTHYRQLGYENRALQTEDFLDANKDGGELGVNHQITVLYEIKLSDNSSQADLATLGLSYKRPQGSAVLEITKPIPHSVVRKQSEKASPDTGLAIASAAFAEKLRQSYWSRLYNYGDITHELNNLPLPTIKSKQVTELMNLVRRVNQLDSRNDPYEERNPISTISYDHVPLLR